MFVEQPKELHKRNSHTSHRTDLAFNVLIKTHILCVISHLRTLNVVLSKFYQFLLAQSAHMKMFMQNVGGNVFR